MVRIKVLVCAVLLFAGVAGTASASPASHDINSTTSAQATYVDVHSGMAVCWNLQGATVIPTLGRTSFTGQYCVVGPNFLDGSFIEEVTLAFSKDNGQFTISGSTVSPNAAQTPPPGTWTLSEATGHFAGLAGSGPLTFATSEPGSTLTFTIAGALVRS
jgi:hypothetical protein